MPSWAFVNAKLSKERMQERQPSGEARAKMLTAKIARAQGNTPANKSE